MLARPPIVTANPIYVKQHPIPTIPPSSKAVPVHLSVPYSRMGVSQRKKATFGQITYLDLDPI